jgi:hypothetical protein
MKNCIVEESSKEEASLVIDSIVEYNLSKVPLTQETSFYWINRVIKDMRFLVY